MTQLPPTVAEQARSARISKLERPLSGDESRLECRQWALLSNPQVYDVQAAARALAADTWLVPHGKIRVGDLLAFWKTKARSGKRGIVAFGVVTGAPSEIPPELASLPFWTNGIPDQWNRPQRRIRHRYVVLPNLPLWVEEDDSGLLASLSAARGQGNNAFHFTPNQWERLVEMAGGWPKHPVSPGTSSIFITGVPYRSAARPMAGAGGQEALAMLRIDPSKVERALTAHADTQDQIAALLMKVGIAPLSPSQQDVDFDIAWRAGGNLTVVEVKSITADNEVNQMRQGIGQVLHYRASLSNGVSTHLTIRAVLATEREPRDPVWKTACELAGVTLVWGPEFRGLLNISSGTSVRRSSSDHDVGKETLLESR